MSAEAAVEAIKLWRSHPAAMVEQLFGVKPDPWQANTLEAFPHQTRISMQACKGPGKTTVLAWLGWNYLLTRPACKGAATSIDAKNLASNLWAEFAFWQDKSELLKRAFTWTKTRIASNEHPEFKFIDARTWPKDADKQRQTDTLAGLHADYVLFLIDESGSIPVPVLVAAEAALSSCKEGHVVQAGNCASTDGMLYVAHKDRQRWFVVEVTGDPDDPNRAPRISLEWARDEIRTHGRDNPWVMINVLGKFPPSAINALVSLEDVEAAMNRYWRPHEIGSATPLGLGVDVARFGDDASIICPRQGIQVLPLARYRNIDSTQGAAQVNRTWRELDADACFLDMSGGWGTGWYDQLKLLGRAPIGVNFGGKANNSKAYFNKRAEMYLEAAAWIRNGGALPQSRELKEALYQTTYTYTKDAILLEPKDILKQRLGFSPDEADAFVLTFAEPIAQRRTRGPSVAPSAIDKTYDPYATVDMARDSEHVQNRLPPNFPKW